MKARSTDLYLNMIDKNMDEQPEEMRLLGVKAERYVSQLRKYCIRLSEHKLHDREARNLAFLSSIVNNFAEMAEKTKNMEESFVSLKKSGESFSEGARRDISTFGSAVQEILGATVHDYATQNTRLAGTVQVYREIITDLLGKITRRNVRRLHSGECSPEGSRVFSELCTGFERIIDRCDSIAGHILLNAGESAAPPTEEQYDRIRALFNDKFSELE